MIYNLHAFINLQSVSVELYDSTVELASGTERTALQKYLLSKILQKLFLCHTILLQLNNVLSIFYSNVLAKMSFLKFHN